jgi:cell volume regulation protein A
MNLETALIVGAALAIVSVVLSKASERVGVPTLLIFLAVGMLAGSDGPGGIYFDDPRFAQRLGVVALAFILFAGGLETDWPTVRPVLWRGISLATGAVVLSAVIVAGFAAWMLGFTWLEGCLLGSIVASTDAAAVFSVLRSRNVSLKGHLRPLLELESGSNDPMAVFLTMAFIGLMTRGNGSVWHLALDFLLQMPVGLLVGWGVGRGMLWLINRLKLAYEGLYLVLTLATVLLTYGAASALGGNGFLAVYVTGLIFGNSAFVHKKSLVRFHDGLAWLMQIGMFLALGLLVYPSELPPVAGRGILLSLVLIFVARPVSVFLSLSLARMNRREKALVSWVGLRGAVPIVLATFPLLAGLPKASMIFNLVFFIVITSALVQGISIPWMAKRLGVEAPLSHKRRFPLEEDALSNADMRLVDFILPYGSAVAGKPIVELAFPEESRITLVCRGDRFIVPGGATMLEEGDVLWVLVNDRTLEDVKRTLTATA